MTIHTYKRKKHRLLAVFAHPDDETFCAGGTLAHHVEQGGEAMVVSFTKGQRGQIRDPNAASRRTLGAVREQEFYLACERLGVQQALCLDYMDGSLSELDPEILVGEVVRLIRVFRPDTVLTFDREGGYGHPDHIAISNAVTRAFHQAGNINFALEQQLERHSPHSPSHLYHSVFIQQDRLLGEEMAHWLTNMGSAFRTSEGFIAAMPFFADELTTVGYARDDVRIQWYPPGVSIIEPGEAGDSLFLILSGSVELVRDMRDGQKRVLLRKGRGEFLGATPLMGRQPSTVHAVAVGGVTCLVFARAQPSLYAPRGAESRGDGAVQSDAQQESGLHRVTTSIDVSPYVERKFAAICAHRTQFPLPPDLLPASILQRLLGTEYFQRIAPPLALETALPHEFLDGESQEQAA